jgi:uncharacterized membrane protein SirB2
MVQCKNRHLLKTDRGSLDRNHVQCDNLFALGDLPLAPYGRKMPASHFPWPDNPMDYVAVKHLHITSVVLSGSFFVLRGIWMLRDSSLLARRWARILPHCVDTVLLGSALVLAAWSGQYPISQPWLTAKLLALLAYVALGTVALKRGRTKQIRAGAFITALAVFAYIVCVAVTKRPGIF